MSVIQQIQEKYAKLMAVIIALALIIFVVMLAFENGGSLFRGGNSNSIGKVNGETIDGQAFQKKVDQQESYMSQQGYGTGAAMRQQAIEATWNQEIGRIIMGTEVNKLGMQIGKREIGDILYGKNPPQDLKQQFTDPATGQYNPQQAKQQIDQMLKKGTAEQKAQFNTYIEQLELMRMNEKYSSLLTNSANYPRWMIEKENADNSLLATTSVVREFYTAVPDSSVKVTDQEITDFVAKHKDDYKQEETRSIAYAAFSALPTAADSNDTKQRLLDLKPGMDSTKDIQQYLESQGVQNYFDGFISGAQIQVPSKDSIFSLPVGGIYGPYLDGASFTLAKLMGVRTQPDTVNVRHILVSTAQQDPQTGQMTPTRDTASAFKLIDSIRIAIANGSNFDSLCAKFSEDGTKDKGGLYEKVTAGRMVPTFNEFIFGHATGAKGIVKTEFGYHYIEILSQKGNSAAYKVAYLPLAIEASRETDAAASNEATQFAGNSRNMKDFDANIEKLRSKGINKGLAADLPKTGYQIQGLGISRAFVKNIYDAKLGDVLQPELVGSNYVVAIVTEVNEKGTQTAAKARLLVEPLLRNHKKAEILAKKIGTITTLEAASTALGGKPIELADSIRMSGTQSPVVANEPKVIGASFNPANKGKVVTTMIEGTNGVYVIRVDNVSATAVADANVPEQRKVKYQQLKMAGGNFQQALMDAADIKDNRAKIY